MRRYRRQSGQALIYGIFVLMAGLAALFFLFNTSQLTHEKTKLVNTADAVAYSAGVMHARALNFNAYTNRALLANEVMIAQAASIASWASHIAKHSENVPPLNCRTWYSVPVALTLAEYIPVCYLLTYANGSLNEVNRGVQEAARATVAASEAAKDLLQAAQANMAVTFIPARKALLQEVADANYAGDGAVHVDTIPITDNFTLFEGALFIQAYSGAERGRFKNATVTATNLDAFIKQRSWTSANDFPCITQNKAAFRRRGGTELIGFDAWKAMDTASLHTWSWTLRGLLRLPSCDEHEMALGYGAQAAAASVPSDRSASYGASRADNPAASAAAGNARWSYGGLPTFQDLSSAALHYSGTDPGPRLKFAIRLTRAKDQLKTSDGASAIQPTGRLASFDGKPAANVLAAVATSEVYFERPVGRADGKTELASLFNPYWQVHLISTSAADAAIAMTLGGPR